MTQRAAPQLTPLSEPYFNAAKEGKLCLQQCLACHQHQFYPRSLCVHCGADHLEWVEVSGWGRIASFTVVRRGISPAYPAPYVVALVDLDEGPRMMSQIHTADASSLAIGLSVHVAFEPWVDDLVLPVFKPAQECGES